MTFTLATLASNGMVSRLAAMKSNLVGAEVGIAEGKDDGNPEGVDVGELVWNDCNRLVTIVSAVTLAVCASL